MNFYKVHRDYANGMIASSGVGPFAYVIPADQRDNYGLFEMLDILQFGAVEIHRATAPFTANGKQYAAGSFVVKTAQPYGPFANTMLSRQDYPDLRILDKASGRVLYLDPKLFERGSRASSLRTFYFEPKRETNKILNDAHHLIVGFEHDGEAGAWTFLGWELVDLANFRVKLKAEFQAANRDLYKPDAVLLRSATNAPSRNP